MNQPTFAAGADFNGTIVVLLDELDPEQPVFDDLRDQAAATGLGELVDFFNHKAVIGSERLLPTDPVKDIRAAEQANEAAGFQTLRSLTRYWRIYLNPLVQQPDPPTPLAAVASDDDDYLDEEVLIGLVFQLNELPGVTTAYAEMTATDPSADIGINPMKKTQGFLGAAAEGIDVDWARSRLGGRGEKVGLVDVEKAWRVDHVEYGGKPPALICNEDQFELGINSGHHGNGSLVIVGGADNDRGGIGIAPLIRDMRRASHHRNGRALHVAEAVKKAADTMEAGDVMLIEVDRSETWPVEVQLADFDAIRYAVAKGVVVIAAGGNGNRDLDVVPADLVQPNSDPRGIGWWFDPTTPDSGATLVGAAKSELCPHGTGHRRWRGSKTVGSNHGSPVHCHAWGEHVVTADAKNTDSYVDDFGGTSAASAIVAGAAVLIQAMHRAAGGGPLTSIQLRELLADPALGTEQCPDLPGHIGPMPDLRKIGADPRVGAVPDAVIG